MNYNALLIKMFGLLAFFLTIQLKGFSQFNITGNAYPIVVDNNCVQSDTCFTLTDNIGQAGAVYHEVRFDLSHPFDGVFCLYLGDADTTLSCYDDGEDNGADGFAFVLKDTNAINLGATGGGLGFNGITPCVAIEFDTYPNPGNGDIGNIDHTALYFNGDQTNTIQGPVPLIGSGINAEDGQHHNARLVWNPATFELSLFFDGVLLFSHIQDIVTDIFGGNPIVDWGFTASTGGCYNIQQICFPEVEVVLDPLHVICEDDSVHLSYYADNLTSYVWLDPALDTIKSWNISSGLPLTDTSFYANQAGIYTVEVVLNNQTVSGQTEVVVAEYPEYLEPDSILFCPRDSLITLSAANNVPGATYTWTPSGSTSSSVVVDSTEFVTVTIVEPINGCTTIDSTDLTAYCTPIVELPNIFSPNGDGINDVAVAPVWSWVGNYSVDVYNRWGQLIYSGENNFWDGMNKGQKEVSTGAYYYVFNFFDFWNQYSEERIGVLQLVR